MFTREELENIKTGNLVTRFCSSCGWMVEQVPSERFLSQYSETIICPKCGKDNSRKMPLRLKLKRILKRVLQ